MAAIVLTAFLAAHAGIEHAGTSRRAVVGGEDEDRVLFQAFIGQQLAQLADVVVDIGNHAKEVGLCHFQLLVRCTEGLGRVHRTVRSVGGNVGEERFAGLFLCQDELLRGSRTRRRCRSPASWSVRR